MARGAILVSISSSKNSQHRPALCVEMLWPLAPVSSQTDAVCAFSSCLCRAAVDDVGTALPNRRPSLSYTPTSSVLTLHFTLLSANIMIKAHYINVRFMQHLEENFCHTTNLETNVCDSRYI